MEARTRETCKTSVYLLLGGLRWTISGAVQLVHPPHFRKRRTTRVTWTHTKRHVILASREIRSMYAYTFQ